MILADDPFERYRQRDFAELDHATFIAAIRASERIDKTFSPTWLERLFPCLAKTRKRRLVRREVTI